MAVAFDAGSVGNDANVSSSYSWTHTPVGTPTAVGVWVIVLAGQTVSSVTYGGTSMTVNTSVNGVQGNTECVNYIYGLTSPPSGAQTVQVNMTGTTFSFAMAVTVTGSNTTTCFRSAGFNSANSGTIDIQQSITTVSGDLVVSLGWDQSSGSPVPTPDGGQTTAASGMAVGNASGIGTYSSASGTSTQHGYTIHSAGAVIPASFELGASASPVEFSNAGSSVIQQVRAIGW